MKILKYTASFSSYNVVQYPWPEIPSRRANRASSIFILDRFSFILGHNCASVSNPDLVRPALPVPYVSNPGFVEFILYLLPHHGLINVFQYSWPGISARKSNCASTLWFTSDLDHTSLILGHNCTPASNHGMVWP